MNWFQILQLTLLGASAVLEKLRANKAPAEVITAAEQGVAKLNEVYGSAVTRQQLEGLTVDPIA